jgi:uncharacterized membrane protein YfcA
VPRGRVALVGAVAGLTSGLFGVGGGIVLVPALIALAGFEPKLATGTSLTAIVPISLAGAVGYATAGEVDWPAAALVAAGALAGAVVGTHLLRRIDPSTLQRLFAVLMVATAVRMLVESGDGDGRGAITLVGGIALALVGVGSGLLAGLLGVGGGIVIVPALTIGFGLPLALAKGTSLAVIIPTAVAGTVRNRGAGLTALRPAAVVGGAGIATALVAARLSVGLDAGLSAALFAGLLLVVAARLLRNAGTPTGE